MTSCVWGGCLRPGFTMYCFITLVSSVVWILCLGFFSPPKSLELCFPCEISGKTSHPPRPHSRLRWACFPSTSLNVGHFLVHPFTVGLAFWVSGFQLEHLTLYGALLAWTPGFISSTNLEAFSSESWWKRGVPNMTANQVSRRSWEKADSNSGGLEMFLFLTRCQLTWLLFRGPHSEQWSSGPPGAGVCGQRHHPPSLPTSAALCGGIFELWEVSPPSLSCQLKHALQRHSRN